MDIDDNDEIEREIDIVYSGQFSNETKIFQFPLIPKNLMNIENINSLSISQNSKNMKMEMKIDEKYLDKNNYNAVPIQNLKGEKIENNSNLCLGIIKNNKLILTPISQIFQFRHDFSNVNKEKNIMLKIKGGKKEQKNIGIKKEEKDEMKFSPLSLYLPNSIESKIAMEKISNLEGQPQKANFMNKDEYFNFMLKYVIIPDSEVDTNDDFLALYKNNFSNSIIESVKEEKNEDENIIIEEKTKEEKKSSKKPRGFSHSIDSIRNNEKEIKSDNNYSVMNNVINSIFENNDCISYDDLLMSICQKMKISNTDDEKINRVKKEIEENCILIKQKYCFLKDNESEVKDVRNFLIKEIGNNENGMKKQQIKRLIEQNGLNISDNKLTKLLQKICKYQGNVWIIKLPDEIEY
jgi:hypothetical protein